MSTATFLKRWEQREALNIERDLIVAQREQLAAMTPLERVQWEANQGYIEKRREMIEERLLELGRNADAAWKLSTAWAEQQRADLGLKGWL